MLKAILNGWFRFLGIEKQKKGENVNRIKEHIRFFGSATADELVDQLMIPHASVSGCLSNLAAKGMLEKSKEYRTSRKGRAVVVYKFKDHPKW